MIDEEDDENDQNNTQSTGSVHLLKQPSTIVGGQLRYILHYILY